MDVGPSTTSERLQQHTYEELEEDPFPTGARSLGGKRRIRIHRVSTRLESEALGVRAVKIGFEAVGGRASQSVSPAGSRGISSNLAALVQRRESIPFKY